MNEFLEKLPKTPLYENFTKYLNSLKSEDSEAILGYVLSSKIPGNPVLEELFMREQSAVFQLLVHNEAYGAFREDVDVWIAGLEPRFQGAAEEFFNGLTDFVGDAAALLMKSGDQVAHDLVQAQATLVTETGKVIQAGAVQLKAALDAHAQEKMAELQAYAESERKSLEAERKRVAKVLVDRFDETIAPHIKKSFLASTDEFRFKRIAYRVGEFFVAISMFQGLKIFFF